MAVLPLVTAAVAGVGLVYLAVNDPHQPGHYPGCPIRALTGFWCPGCGGLRAAHDLVHGQFSAALSSNLLVVLLAPIVVALWVRWSLIRVGAVPGRADRSIPGRLLGLLLVAIALFGILRNLPATAWLAP